jgi:hypothetical protein
MPEARTLLTIEYRAVEDLIPYARNSRTHSDAQVAQIAASIREFGFTNPVLVDPDGGIIAGHGRVLAARKLALEQVPTIELGHLTDAQRRAYIIADNKLALNAEHPTMKPVALFEYQMLNNTKGGDAVLDSFGGSGTTLIAAEKNGRIARLMELDPRYCDVIVKRWQDYTGKQATLEATGQTFSEVATGRVLEAA